MSIIVNGITIPVNGDFIFSNNTNIDTIVANGITVWEKRKSIVLYDGRKFYDGRTTYPFLNNQCYYYGDAPSAGNNWRPPAPYLATSGVNNGGNDELFFSSLQHPYQDARYGTMGNTDYKDIYDPGISTEECSKKYITPSSAYGAYNNSVGYPYLRPSMAMYNMWNIDCTNYDYLIVSAIGEITTTPSGNMHNATELILGLDFYGQKTADQSLIYVGAYNGENPYVFGSLVNFKGHGHDDHLDLNSSASGNHPIGWRTFCLDIRNLTGVHTLRGAITCGSYKHDGWIRIAYIAMCCGDPYANPDIDFNWPY